MILNHFNLNMLSRRKRLYTTKKTVQDTSAQLIQFPENAMSLAELHSDDENSICDASISSHCSNVLSHQRLLVI